MDAASGPLVDSINGDVKLFGGGGGGGNLNNLSMIQDGIISSTNHNHHHHHHQHQLNQLHQHDNHINLGVAAEMGLIKVGGDSPMLPESNDLIYTDLSNNVTLKQDHHHNHQHNHLQNHQHHHPQVGGGEYSSTSGGLWSNGGDAFGGGMGAGGGALDFSDLVNISNCSSGGNNHNHAFGVGGGGHGAGGTMSMPVSDGGGNGGMEDLDNVSCPTPSLSDNDNFSFLSDCSESGGGGGGGEGKLGGSHNHHGIKRENDYVQAWVSSEPPNPFPLPSLSTVSALRQLEQPSSVEVPQVPWLDGAEVGEGGSFTTINTADLDSLLGPNSVTASGSTTVTAGATSSSLKCGECSKTFDNPMTLQIHMRLHTGERPYKCAKCEEAFIHYTYLDYHMTNSHGGKSPSKASPGQRRDSPEKKKSVNANGLLLGPPPTINTKAGLGNSRTKSKAKKKNGLVDSSADPAPNGAGGSYPCPYCQRGFRHSSWLIAHMRTHTGEKPFKCTHCDLAYTQRGNLMSHLKRQHNIIDDGTICPSTTSTPAISITNVPVKPEVQTSSTSTNLTLRRIKTKKKKPPSSMPRLVDQTIGSESHSHETLPTLVNQSNGGRPVKCTICGAAFSQRQALSVHMRSHGEAAFPCSECGRKFRQPGNLRKHVRDMHGDPNNGQSSSGVEVKSQPVLTHPPEAIPYLDKYDIRPCTVKVERCDPATSGGKDTKRKKPIKSVFSKKKLGGLKQGRNFKKPMAFPPSGPGYQCTVCDKVLLTTTNLTVHMRIHTGEKPYQCSFCKKMFSVQSNLKAHERLHTGEKPYQCSLCSTSFTTRGNFTAHLRSHGVNPYKCSMCTEQFTFSWKLKKHMFVAHNKKMKAEHKQIAS